MTGSSDSAHEQQPVFRRLLADGFSAPACWRGDQVIAVPATPRWAALDHAAVMASRAELQGLFGTDDPWPPADLTRAQDAADLAWHEEEFRQRTSFAYSLLSPDRRRCLGCLYLYPTASPAHDGEAYLWTSANAPEALRQAVTTEVIAWLASSWPFRALAWPGRCIPFSAWPFPNHYTLRRHLR